MNTKRGLSTTLSIHDEIMSAIVTDSVKDDILKDVETQRLINRPPALTGAMKVIIKRFGDSHTPIASRKSKIFRIDLKKNHEAMSRAVAGFGKHRESLSEEATCHRPQDVESFSEYNK